MGNTNVWILSSAIPTKDVSDESLVVSEPASSGRFVEHPDKGALVPVDCVHQGWVLLTKAEQQGLEGIRVGLD